MNIFIVTKKELMCKKKKAFKNTILKSPFKAQGHKNPYATCEYTSQKKERNNINFSYVYENQLSSKFIRNLLF